jgi:hypothetical protein
MSPKYGAPGSPEELEARAAADKALRAEERAGWLMLWHTYERCIEIAERVWDEKLDVAQFTQDSLAQGMRDRGAEGNAGGLAIPVPLFTPRDRMQFIKEVAAHLNIEAGHRHLTVRFPKEKPTDAPTQPEAQQAAGIEAASGTSESDLEQEAREVASQGDPPTGQVGSSLPSPNLVG